MADLAAWYGINPYSLTAEQRAGLLANLDRIRLQKLIVHRDLSNMDEEQLYQLYYDAFGDKALAEEVRLKALEAKIQREARRQRSPV